jgi:hypothetical protein
MNQEKIYGSSDLPAKIISVVFHPVFMPLYGLGLIFSSGTLPGLPFSIKKILFLIVLLNNVIVPLALLPFFRNRNIITSYTIDDQVERIIPLVTATILYFITAYIFNRFPVHEVLKSFVFGSAFLAAVITAVNFRWKISVHAAGAGALIAAVLALSIRMDTALTGYLLGVILIGGVILSSRLRLNNHTPSQVWYGCLTGFVVLGLSVLVI